MGEIVVWIIKMAVLVAPVVISAGLLSAFVLLSMDYLFSPVNTNVLQDLFALVQMWLPFNLGTILLFCITAPSAWLAYRLSMLTLNYLRLVIEPGSNPIGGPF